MILSERIKSSHHWWVIDPSGWPRGKLDELLGSDMVDPGPRVKLGASFECGSYLVAVSEVGRLDLLFLLMLMDDGE